MDLRDYYLSLTDEERTAFVKKAGTSKNYIHSMTSKGAFKRHPGPQLARRIHAASGGEIPLSKLRPDIWPA